MSTESERLAERIKAEVAKAPPLSDERIDQLIGMLYPGTTLGPIPESDSD